VDLFTMASTVAAVLAGAIASIAGFGIGSVLTPVVRRSSTCDSRSRSCRFPTSPLRSFVSFSSEPTSTEKCSSDSAPRARSVGWSVRPFRPWSRARFWPRSSVYCWSSRVWAASPDSRSACGSPRAGPRSSVARSPGLLGGLVANQGEVPAAALLGFDVEREAFVATATAVTRIVDGARVPVYLVTQVPSSRRTGRSCWWSPARLSGPCMEGGCSAG
jgi:hypothetical protein